MLKSAILLTNYFAVISLPNSSKKFPKSNKLIMCKGPAYLQRRMGKKEEKKENKKI